MKLCPSAFTITAALGVFACTTTVANERGGQQSAGTGAAPAAGGTGTGTGGQLGTGATPGTGGLGTGGINPGTGAAPAGTGATNAGTGAGPGLPTTMVPADYPRGMSPGCGKPPPGDHQPGAEPGYTYTMDTTPDQAWLEEFNADESEYLDRKYRVRIPLGYDYNTPYTVNIIGGGCGGGNDSWGGLGAWRRDDDPPIIHVHPAYKGGCYEDDGVNNPEVIFMQDWWPEFINNYCVDLERVFITGWSSGAWESYTMGCNFPGTIRGIGPASGGQRQRRNECGGPIAAIMAADVTDGANPIHDTLDNSNCAGTEAEGCWMGKLICTGDYATRNDFPNTDPRSCVDEGTAVGRDLILERNGCVGTETEPWGGTIDDIPLESGGIYRYPTFMHTDPGDPVPQGDIDAVKDFFPVPADGMNNQPACHKYTGCPEQFPVVWCMTYDDGHSPESRISENEGDDGRTGFQRFFEDDVPRYAAE